MFGIRGKVIVSIMLILYVYGVVVSKCIMTGKIMHEVFKDVNVLNNYYLWLSLFFLISATLSFRDVTSTKIV